MATTIPPVHNYESQIVFSNQSNNIKSTDVINWTIAPSGDDVYFNLYKSRMTLKLKIEFANADDVADAPRNLYVPVKKNMAGIVDNTKVTYTYWDGDKLSALPLSADNENIGQVRSLLNALTDNRHNNEVNEGLKELSYIYYDSLDYDRDPAQLTSYIDLTDKSANVAGRPYGGKLFYNYLKFHQAQGDKYAYCTINVNFSDIFEGCSQERFIHLTQMDAQIYPTNDDAYFYFDTSTTKKIQVTTNPSGDNLKYVEFKGVYFDTCTLWYHSYKTADDSTFDPEDTQLVKNQIMTKTFQIMPNVGRCDDRVLVNFPIKMMFILFTDSNGDFSKLKDVRFKRIALNIAGEQKRIINVDNTNTPEGNDHTFFEWMDYLCNSRSDEYDTLLTYKTWTKQFHVYAFPMGEWFPMRAANQVQFEIELDNSYEGAPNKADMDDGKTGRLQMHLIMVRANTVST